MWTSLPFQNSIPFNTRANRSTLLLLCEERNFLKPQARKLYAKIHAAERSSSSVAECGSYISQAYPFVGASPDGIITCSCCVGVGGLEIKTTRIKRI